MSVMLAILALCFVSTAVVRVALGSLAESGRISDGRNGVNNRARHLGCDLNTAVTTDLGRVHMGNALVRSNLNAADPRSDPHPRAVLLAPSRVHPPF